MWRQGNMGARLKESVAINSSLMTLGRCLEALRWNQQHRQQEPRLVPYRESKARTAFSLLTSFWNNAQFLRHSPPSCKAGLLESRSFRKLSRLA